LIVESLSSAFRAGDIGVGKIVEFDFLEACALAAFTTPTFNVHAK
jgi:hypothetical protein